MTEGFNSALAGIHMSEGIPTEEVVSMCMLCAACVYDAENRCEAFGIKESSARGSGITNVLAA